MRSAASWRSMSPFVCAVVFSVSACLAQSPAPATPSQSAPAGQSGEQPAANDAAQPSVQQPTGQDPNAQQPTAQEPANDPGMFVFKKQVEEVFLHVTVVDDQQHPVTNLDRSAFTVFERGAAQTITSFRKEDVPVAIGIVVDNSGSMRDKREKVNQAVLNLIRASNPRDQVFVVNFSQEPYLDQDFTSDVNLLQTALHQVSAKGSTALYDAIVASAVHLRNNSQIEKKVLLVITDGQDNMSRETLQEAEQRLERANGPVVYSIGLIGSGMQARGHDALESLSTGTGGVAYFPETIDAVDSITRNIAHDIRSQYTIAYKPQNATGEPKYQSVKVEVHAPGYAKLTARTKTGYYPPEGAH